MADPNKFKSVSYSIESWKDLGEIAASTNRTRAKMATRLIRFWKENKGDEKNGYKNGKNA